MGREIRILIIEVNYYVNEQEELYYIDLYRSIINFLSLKKIFIVKIDDINLISI